MKEGSFEIPENVKQNNKANVNLKVKEDTLVPGKSILEAQASIYAHHEWKIKEIIFTLNLRESYEYFDYLFMNDGCLDVAKAELHKSYVIWKDTKPGKSISNELIIEFKYPIPINDNTPASFIHISYNRKWKSILDYFVMIKVVSGDTEQSLLMTLPIRMLSFSLLKPGLSNSKLFELTDCGCMSDGNVDERLSIADPNLSLSKLNISADYSINNKTKINISSISFTLTDIVHLIGSHNDEKSCLDSIKCNKSISYEQTIAGIPKGGNTQGKIDLAIQPDLLHSNGFGISNGINIKRFYILTMTPKLDLPPYSPSEDCSVSCLLNAAQVIEGLTQNYEINVNNPSINTERPFLNPNNQISPINFNPITIPDTILVQKNVDECKNASKNLKFI